MNEWPLPEEVPAWWLEPLPMDADTYQREALADAQDEEEGEDLG